MSWHGVMVRFWAKDEDSLTPTETKVYFDHTVASKCIAIPRIFQYFCSISKYDDSVYETCMVDRLNNGCNGNRFNRYRLTLYAV